MELVSKLDIAIKNIETASNIKNTKIWGYVY